MAILKHAWCLLLLCAYFSAHDASAQTAVNSLQLHEEEIKAGLLYNFLKYTEWPSTETSTKMTVCLFSNDPLESHLRPMTGRTVNQKEITVKSIASTMEAIQCQLLYLHEGQKKRWPDVREKLTGKPVLTVSDVDGFSTDGGMIEFGRKDSRISVSLNTTAVTAAGLSVHERLRKLMSVVHEGNAP